MTYCSSCVGDTSYYLQNNQTMSISAVTVFLFFNARSHIFMTVLSNLMISFQVRLYNRNGNPRVLSFTTFPLHVGIV